MSSTKKKLKDLEKKYGEYVNNTRIANVIRRLAQKDMEIDYLKEEISFLKEKLKKNQIR